MFKYTAIFPNGIALKRRSDRVYTHAWLACGNYSEERVAKAQADGWNIKSGSLWQESGFSGSRVLAEKALAAARTPERAADGGYFGITDVTPGAPK